MLNKLRNKLIQKVFIYLYNDFLFPFDDLDREINKMDREERYLYLSSASRFVKSECYKKEIKNIVGQFYKDLSTKPLSSNEIAHYRMSLIFIRQFEQRLNKLAQRAEIEQQL